MASAEPPPARPARTRNALLWLSLGLLLLVGLTGPNAANPALGPRGWAPGQLPWHLGPWATTATLAAAYLLGAVAVWLGLRNPRYAAWRGWVQPVALGVAALVTTPFGTGDHTNYVAYGQVALSGGDPWVVDPSQWAGGADPIAGRVEPPWSDTPSIYGPFGTLVWVANAWLGADNLRQAVWWWQVVVVAAWLLVRWVLRRLTDDHARVDVLWTANPLVFGVGVLGAHLDTLAVLLVVVVLWLAPRSAVLAGAVTGLAVSTKFTFGIVALGVLYAWWASDEHRRLGVAERAGRTVAYVLAALVVAAVLHWWAGPNVFDQLGRARRSVSFATPWRPVLEVLTGPLPPETVRSLIFILSGVACLVLAAVLWQLTSGLAAPTVVGRATRLTLVLSAAYALGAPYSLPWYDHLVFACLPVLAASVLDQVLVARAVVLALAYVPGRVVGLTPALESVSLGVRRHVAPYAGLLVWGVLTWLAARRGQRRARPRASGR